jgi:hypothetical protein
VLYENPTWIDVYVIWTTKPAHGAHTVILEGEEKRKYIIIFSGGVTIIVYLQRYVPGTARNEMPCVPIRQPMLRCCQGIRCRNRLHICILSTI